MGHVQVGIAQYRVAEAPTTLVARGLGSCLAVMLYDEVGRRGGLAHVLLPAPRQGHMHTKSATYVTTAIAGMVRELEKAGSQRDDLVAKLVGGSQMFSAAYEQTEAVGTRNLAEALEVLAEYTIPVVAQETGGNCGRSLEFNLASGCVLISTVRAAEPKQL